MRLTFSSGAQQTFLFTFLLGVLLSGPSSDLCFAALYLAPLLALSFLARYTAVLSCGALGSEGSVRSFSTQADAIFCLPSTLSPPFFSAPVGNHVLGAGLIAPFF